MQHDWLIGNKRLVMYTVLFLLHMYRVPINTFNQFIQLSRQVNHKWTAQTCSNVYSSFGLEFFLFFCLSISTCKRVLKKILCISSEQFNRLASKKTTERSPCSPFLLFTNSKVIQYIIQHNLKMHTETYMNILSYQWRDNQRKVSYCLI